MLSVSRDNSLYLYIHDKTKRLSRSLHLSRYFPIHALRSSFDISDASWDRHLPSAWIDLPFLITWQVKSIECVSSSFSCPVFYEEAQKPTSKHQSSSTQTINATSHTDTCPRTYTHLSCFVFFLVRAVLHHWLEADKNHPLQFLRFSSESSSVTQERG